MGGTAATETFWAQHEEEIGRSLLNEQFRGGSFYNPEDTAFYQTTLSGVKNEDSEIFRGLVLEEEEKYLLP